MTISISDKSQTAKELRELEAAIRKVATASPVYSIAVTIVQNACDHIAAVARVHEANAREAERS